MRTKAISLGGFLGKLTHAVSFMCSCGDKVPPVLGAWGAAAPCVRGGTATGPCAAPSAWKRAPEPGHGSQGLALGFSSSEPHRCCETQGCGQNTSSLSAFVSSCKMAIITLTFFIKCLTNAIQQLSIIMIMYKTIHYSLWMLEKKGIMAGVHINTV